MIKARGKMTRAMRSILLTLLSWKEIDWRRDFLLLNVFLIDARSDENLLDDNLFDDNLLDDCLSLSLFSVIGFGSSLLVVASCDGDDGDKHDSGSELPRFRTITPQSRSVEYISLCCLWNYKIEFVRILTLNLLEPQIVRN